MDKLARLTVVTALVLLAQCGGTSDTNDDPGGPALTCSSTATLTNGATLTAPTGVNVVPITVNGSGCNAYPNEPCVSVTICTPSTATCQTINNILLDTGSFGLRVFKSLLNPGLLTAITQGGNTLAECVQYADLSSEWGSVALADIQMGSLTASSVPVEMIESTFQSPPSQCSTSGSVPDTSPTEAGFNGILGVGVFQYDCGSGCVSSANNGLYYGCNGSACLPAAVALSKQVQNPIARMASDNNGLLVEFPTVPDSGASSVTGYLVMGLGTRANNVPPSNTVLTTDNTGEFTTLFPYQTSAQLSGFLDTGSTFYAFPRFSKSSLPFGTGAAAGLDLSQLYCPGSQLTRQATNGTGGACIAINVGNAGTLLNSGQRVFSNIGAYIGTISGFDFGLPFFFGRNVAVGFELKSSSLGTGPLVAY